MKKTILSFILILNLNFLQSQSFKHDLLSIATYESTLDNLRFIDEVKIDPKTFFKNYKKLFGLTEFDSMRNYKVNHFEGGHTVYRFDQYYKGVLVWGSEYLLHQDKNGKIFLGNGQVGSRIHLQVEPKIDKLEGIDLAIQASKCKTKPWDVQDLRKYTLYPQSELIIYNPSFGRDKILNDFTLAYKVEVLCDYPESIFIDAMTGKVIDRFPLKHECIPTNVNTIYNGVQTIYTQDYGNRINLIDDCNYSKIFIYDMRGMQSEASAVIMQNTSNNWTSKLHVQGGTTLWGLKKTYEYFKNKHNYLSFDNQDSDIKAYINGEITDNAYWSGINHTMYFGQSRDLKMSNSSLDIIGHEFTHGVTQFTADLIYQYESGALNESFSDIFGEIVENYVQDTVDWIEGGQLLDGGIRSFIDPNKFYQPKTYLGKHWYYGPNDNGGVHANSGVQNYWFYLLTQGGGSVTGIGFEKSSAIAFKTLQEFLTKNSRYIDARNQSINAAILLYGIKSNEVCQVMNAWHEVGLGDVCNQKSCGSCDCANEIKSYVDCSYYYFNLYENYFDSTLEVPNCKGSKSTKTKEMWYRFVAQDSVHKIHADLINFDSNRMINPSLTLYEGCHKDSIIECTYSYKKRKSSIEIKTTNLKVGKTYYIRFLDFHQEGDTVPLNSMVGLCVTHGAGCSVPKNIKAVRNSQNNGIEFSWDYNPNFDALVMMYYKTLNSFWVDTLIYNYQNFYFYQELTCDSTYLWKIHAQCDYYVGDWSEIDTFKVDSCPYDANLIDLIPLNDTLYVKSGNLIYKQQLMLTGKPIPPKSLFATYYLSKNRDGSTRDYELFTENISQLLQDRRYYVNGKFDLCKSKIPPSTYYLCYILDDENFLKEDNETNNKGVFVDSFSFDCTLIKSDLFVDTATIVFNDNILNYKNEVSNIGFINCSKFNVGLYLIDPITKKIQYKLQSARIDTLDVYEIYSIDWTINMCKFNIDPKEYQVMFFADSAQEISENNRLNNFDIKPKNLKIECNIDLLEKYGNFSYDSGKATFDISILNAGTTNSAPFQVGFYLSKSPTLSTLDFLVGRFSINAIQSGKTYQVKRTYDVCKKANTGNYYMGYIIDFDNNVYETNEDNNLYVDTKSIDVACNHSSIQSQNEQDITLYPNPTNDVVYISNLKHKVLVNVYNIQGKLMKSVYTKESLSLEELSSGTYIIKLDEKVFRITKNK